MGLEPIALELFSSKKNLNQFENEFRPNEKVQTLELNYGLTRALQSGQEAIQLFGAVLR